MVVAQKSVIFKLGAQRDFLSTSPELHHTSISVLLTKCCFDVTHRVYKEITDCWWHVTFFMITVSIF